MNDADNKKLSHGQIIANDIKQAIDESCAGRELEAYIAAIEATRYLRISVIFSTICPYANAILVGVFSAIFSYFVSPHLPVPLAVIGFIASILAGDALPNIIYALMATPHRANFNQITGRDLKEIITGKQPNQKLKK